MKVRTGFVSNSSSSSFCVVFPKRPKSKEELMKIMFPGKKPDDHKTEVVDHVWGQLDEQKKSASKKEIAESMRSRFHYAWQSRNCGRFTTDGRLVHGPCWFLDDEEKPYYIDESLQKQLIELELKDESLRYDSEFKKKEEVWKEKEKIVKKIATQEAEKLVEDNKEKFIALFEFADDSSIGSVCEHGGIFEESGLLTIRSSNH